jgi:hypothetical protein
VTEVSLGSRPAEAASPAIAMENSPREMSVAPARVRSRGSRPARRPPHRAVTSFVTAPSAARTNAAVRAGGIVEGSTERPTNAKKIAANRSRRGARSGPHFSMLPDHGSEGSARFEWQNSVKEGRIVREESLRGKSPEEYCPPRVREPGPLELGPALIESTYGHERTAAAERSLVVVGRQGARLVHGCSCRDEVSRRGCVPRLLHQAKCSVHSNEPAHLGYGIGMIIHSNVDLPHPRRILSRATHHDQGRRLPSADVAAFGFGSLQRGQEPIRQWAARGSKSGQHGRSRSIMFA